jgi:hypothetical protein
MITAGGGRYVGGVRAARAQRAQRAQQQEAVRARVRANVAESQRARAASNFGKPAMNASPAPGVRAPAGQPVIRRIPLNRGATGPAPANVSYMKPADRFALNAAKRPDVDPNGQFDFIAHGNPSKVQIVRPNGQEVLVDHRVAARLIRQNPAYQPGQPVRLLSCSTGQGSRSFAQNLANKMRVPVRAPDDVLWAYPNGQMHVSKMVTKVDQYTGVVSREPVWPPTGGWRDFTPGTP